MRGALTANTVFSTLILARQASSSLILVVEGDDDHFLVRNHVNERDVVLIGGAGGKQTLLEAADITEQRGMRGVRFLIDADYDRFVNPTKVYPPNVTVSRHHDVITDVLVVGSTLLDKVIDSHSRAGRRNGAEFETHEVRLTSFSLAASIAPLRIVNDRHDYGLRLRDFPFSKLNAVPTTALDLATIAVNRSRTPLTAAGLAREILEEQSHSGVEAVMLVGDHDLFRALSRVLSENGVVAGSDALWTAFLAGVLCAHLGATDWYQELVGWGADHARVTFACPCAA